MNDWFRGVEGAFAEALAGVRACKARGVKVGLRFTITEDNAHMLPAMLDLCEAEGVDEFYLSHLVYAGRGDKHRGEDTEHARTRAAMDLLIARAWAAVSTGGPLEIVTGNNDADAVYFLNWVRRNFNADQASHVEAHLATWGATSRGWGWPISTRRARCIPIPIGRIIPWGRSRPRRSARSGPGMIRCWPRCASARAP